MSVFYKGDAFLAVRGATAAPPDRPVIVFSFYLDDSGTSGLPVVTMAGFIAPLAHWDVVEPATHDIMNRYEVPVFHAKEFHDTKPPFAKWSKIKKRTFVDEIFTAAHGRIYGLSMTVRKSDHLAAQSTGMLPSMSPYGVCFSALLLRAVLDNQIGPSVRKDGVSFLVESGNKNNAEIEEMFHNFTTAPAFEGALRSLTFIPKGSCRAIQIADLFAFYSRRDMRDHDRFSGKLALPANPILRIIERHVPVWQRGAHGRVVETGITVNKVPDANTLRALIRANR